MERNDGLDYTVVVYIALRLCIRIVGFAARPLLLTVCLHIPIPTIWQPIWIPGKLA